MGQLPNGGFDLLILISHYAPTRKDLLDTFEETDKVRKSIAFLERRSLIRLDPDEERYFLTQKGRQICKALW